MQAVLQYFNLYTQRFAVLGAWLVVLHRSAIVLHSTTVVPGIRVHVTCTIQTGELNLKRKISSTVQDVMQSSLRTLHHTRVFLGCEFPFPPPLLLFVRPLSQFSCRWHHVTCQAQMVKCDVSHVTLVAQGHHDRTIPERLLLFDHADLD